MVKNAMNVKTGKAFNYGSELILRQRVQTGEKLNVRNVGRPWDSDHNLLLIKDYILVKNPMNISSVERLL